MAHAAADLIARYYAAFNRADWESMLACLSDDVRHEINQGGVQIGKTAFRAFLSEMQHSYQERLSDVVILAEDARASAEYVVHGTYLQTAPGLPAAAQQSYVLPGGAFFSIHNGQISRVCNYYNLQDWLAQIAR
jgi:steroid delta-isomerase-like uncharacterized protein